MRKSFKKVLCAVMAASMVFSTPIATNVVAQAASGEEGACVVKDLTKTTELTDTVANGAWWTNFSDYYRFEGNFDCTLELTSKTSGTNNWNAPSVVLTTDADRLASGYKEYAVVRADNYGWGDNYDATLATTDSTDWVSWLEIAKDCKATIQVKRSGDTVYVNETYTSSTDDSKVRHQSYTVKNVSADKIRFFLAGDNNEMAITKAVVPDYTVKAKAKLDLVTNGVSKASVEASVLNNGVAVPDATVTYKTSDEKVATVDDKGEVTAVADGNAVITATYAYGEDQTVTADTEVTVTTTAEKVTISGEGVAEGKGTLNILKDKKNGSVAPGKVALTATVTPENAAVKDIVWSVEGSAATVDKNGVVTTTDDAKDGDKVTVKATVKGTEVSAIVEFTIGVKEESFVDPTSVAVTPAAVTANAGEEVKFTAAVYGEDGKTLATNQDVKWSATNASGTAIDVSDEGVLTVPANAKTGDKITVTATSKADAKVVGTATITVRVFETVTGTTWWTAFQASKDRILKGDGSVSFILENNKADTAGNIGFCVEAYAVNEDGSKYVNNDVATTEKGAYITSSYNGSFGGWVAGIPAAKLKATEGTTIDFAANPDNFYNISASKEAFLPEHNYKVTFTKKGNDYLILMKDLNDDTWFYRQMFKGAEMESDTLGIHFMAQLGTFNLVDTNDHLTTNTTDKPQVVRPKPNPGTPSPSPSPSPSNNNTNKNNTTNNDKTITLTDAKSTVKAAKITVKKGKKAVSKVTVKKGKKVTLKVSVNSKGKLSVAKLSKKAKKIAKVTLKKGKLTIKGKKKGKVTLKIKAAKKGKYKKATKSIKVTVK